MVHFITGATSSIGKVLVRKGVELVQGDVRDIDSLMAGRAGVGRATNLAAAVGAVLPEAKWWRTTRDGTANMLVAARRLGIASYVQVSSLSILGDTGRGDFCRRLLGHDCE